MRVARASMSRTASGKSRGLARNNVATLPSGSFRLDSNVRRNMRKDAWNVRARKTSKSEENEPTVDEEGKYLAVGVLGTMASGVCAWSTITLKTTGCGLPPGPGGSIGALEGISFLALVSIIGWSAYTKSKTGKGLPPGPYGLLGAAEGLAYLVFLAYLVVLGLNYVQLGYIPGAVPDANCFG